MKFRDIYYEKKIMKKVYISILCVVAGVISGAYIVGKNILKKLSEVRLISDKHLTLFILTVQWIKVKQQGKNVSDFLKEEGYENIATYGMSYIGERLIDELKNTDINVVYGIDRNINFISSSIDLVSINDNLKTVDAIVVTAVTFFDEIYEELSKKIDCPIISLEDILYII